MKLYQLGWPRSVGCRSRSWYLGKHNPKTRNHAVRDQGRIGKSYLKGRINNFGRGIHNPVSGRGAILHLQQGPHHMCRSKRKEREKSPSVCRSARTGCSAGGNSPWHEMKTMRWVEGNRGGLFIFFEPHLPAITFPWRTLVDRKGWVRSVPSGMCAVPPPLLGPVFHHGMQGTGS